MDDALSDAIDPEFEFHEDSPRGDPDRHSPTLRRYHQVLWTKPLPSGTVFTLTREPRAYLVHRSPLGTFYLSSDAITTRLWDRAASLIARIPSAELPVYRGYTVGSALLFPGKQINRQYTINQARGMVREISDRFDLTLECVRRHYAGEPSPLGATMQRYADFFALFEDFRSYVEFWLLQDLVDTRTGRVRFFVPFEGFTAPAVPPSIPEYLAFVDATEEFIDARTERIMRDLLDRDR